MTAGLDRVESLAPGSGRLDAGLFTQGTLSGGAAGVYTDLEARLNKELSAFGRAEAAYDWRLNEMAWQALAGLRWRL